jgi:hypothetical protein
MPFDCQHRTAHGQDACVDSCPTTAGEPTFAFARVERDRPLPPSDLATVDVALLDMHHGWPNLGHDAIVYAVQNIVCDLSPALRKAGLRVRVTSYDVRRGHRIPEAPGPRHAIYVGTGGPGHIDPHLNDGVSEGSQEIREDPAWEAPLFHLFDAILADREAALFALCHTFGVLCRWLSIADVVLRGPEKGGKSLGVVENLLTDAAIGHPWFGHLAAELPDRRRLKILDSRLYDLLPHPPFPEGVSALSFEALGAGGPQGDALTAVEVARDRGGVMPRILGVNHHPEIVNRARQLSILKKRRERGAVTDQWYDERVRTLTETIGDARGEYWLNLTSAYMFLGPLRFHLYKQIRLRAALLGRHVDIDEARTPIVTRPSAGTADVAVRSPE